MKTLIVGIGSFQGEDQIGWVLIDELKTSFNAEITLFKSKGDGSDWYHEIKDNQQVIFIDAMLCDDETATMFELSVNDLKKLPAMRNKSTHSISLDDSISMAKNLGMLNVPVRIIGISVSSLCLTASICLTPFNLPSEEMSTIPKMSKLREQIIKLIMKTAETKT